jgi:hypothetical protein
MTLQDNFLNKTMMTLRLIIVAMLVLSGCQEETITGGGKGDIMGFVALLDETGFEIKDKSNIKVTLDDNHSVVTNASGRFDFKDVEAGTYHVLFEKEGFGSVKRFNFIFTGGNVPGIISDVNMVDLSDITILSKQVETSSNAVTVSGTMSNTDQYYFVYYFYDKQDAEISEYINSYGTTYCCGPVTTFTHSVAAPTTSPLYIACYAVSMANKDGRYNYYDYEKARSVNPAVKQLFAPIRIR